MGRKQGCLEHGTVEAEPHAEAPILGKSLYDAGQRSVGIGAGGQHVQGQTGEFLLTGPEVGERSGWSRTFQGGQPLFGFLVPEPHTSPGTLFSLVAPLVDSVGKPLFPSTGPGSASWYLQKG